nr:MAG TPA: hypothetical protein [Caudoviricetes sp.]
MLSLLSINLLILSLRVVSLVIVFNLSLVIYPVPNVKVPK